MKKLIIFTLLVLVGICIWYFLGGQKDDLNIVGDVNNKWANEQLDKAPKMKYFRDYLKSDNRSYKKTPFVTMRVNGSYISIIDGLTKKDFYNSDKAKGKDSRSQFITEAGQAMIDYYMKNDAGFSLFVIKRSENVSKEEKKLDILKFLSNAAFSSELCAFLINEFSNSKSDKVRLEAMKLWIIKHSSSLSQSHNDDYKKIWENLPSEDQNLREWFLAGIQGKGENTWDSMREIAFSTDKLIEQKLALGAYTHPAGEKGVKQLWKICNQKNISEQLRFVAIEALLKVIEQESLDLNESAKKKNERLYLRNIRKQGDIWLTKTKDKYKDILDKILDKINALSNVKMREILYGKYLKLKLTENKEWKLLVYTIPKSQAKIFDQRTQDAVNKIIKYNSDCWNLSLKQQYKLETNLEMKNGGKEKINVNIIILNKIRFKNFQDVLVPKIFPKANGVYRGPVGAFSKGDKWIRWSMKRNVINFHPSLQEENMWGNSLPKLIVKRVENNFVTGITLGSRYFCLKK